MQIRLESSRASVVVDPTAGGRLASLRVDGSELLVARTDDPLAWGCYPMVPFAGRIRDGVLRFDGRRHELPRTLGAHAIHGYGFTSSWTPTGDATIELRLRAPWPFAARVTQRFELAADALLLHMRLDAEERQPVGLGWHPWFVRTVEGRDDLSLDFGADAMYELDETEIPTGRLVPPPPGPWDNCFTGVGDPPVLHWGELSLQLTSSADHWVVYDMPRHAMCVEPQTGPPDEANSAPRVLEAGEHLEIDFRLDWG